MFEESIFDTSILITKYVQNRLTEEEEQVLKQWRQKSSRNNKLFIYLTTLDIEEDERVNIYLKKEEVTKKAYTKFLNNRKRKQRKIFIRYILNASIFLLPLMGIATYLLHYSYFHKETITSKPIPHQTNKTAPVLLLKSGEKIKIENNNETALSRKGFLFNSDTETEIKDINTETEWRVIETPTATTFNFVLSDGTKVYMNSQSKFEYWSPFLEKERIVRIQGEVYIEVAQKESSPFKVQLNNLEITVLGTSFNIKAYDKSKAIKVTLKSGSIEAKTVKSKYIIEPGQQIYLDRETNYALVKHVNVEDEISWRNGIYTFKDEALSEISRVIEDWYEIEVVFENIEAKEALYTGIIKKNEDLDVFVKRLHKSSKNIKGKIEGNYLYIK